MAAPWQYRVEMYVDQTLADGAVAPRFEQWLNEQAADDWEPLRIGNWTTIGSQGSREVVLRRPASS